MNEPRIGRVIKLIGDTQDGGQSAIRKRASGN
jgi:hypothetical protein